MTENDKKIILAAHDYITRRKGKDYAPTAKELQDVIVNVIEPYLWEVNMSE